MIVKAKFADWRWLEENTPEFKPEKVEKIKELFKVGQVDIFGEYTGDIQNFIEIDENFTILQVYERREIPKKIHESLKQKAEKEVEPKKYLNQKINVHIPSLPLLTFNEVEHLDDCCTNYLQQRLDDGWRIITVCPQPDQRRPDYIIGRNTPDDEGY